MTPELAIFRTDWSANMRHELLHGEITDRILRCAVDVHRALGPGLSEATYQRAMAIAMAKDGLEIQVEPVLEVQYEGATIGKYRPDFIVQGVVVLEIKAVKQTEPAAAAQMLKYLRASGLRVGLLVNFNAPIISLGVKRFVL